MQENKQHSAYKRLKPILVVLLILILGLASTFLAYHQLTNAQYEKNIGNYEYACKDIYRSLKKELDTQKEILEIFRFDFYSLGGIQREWMA